MDINGDGKISKEELFLGYKKCCKVLVDTEIMRMVTDIFEQADNDKSGALDFSEWTVATINKHSILQEDKLRQTFKMFDKENTGSINANEIKTILGGGKVIGSEKIWNDLISEVDVNGDGSISYPEFKEMMEKFLSQDEYK